MSTKTSPSNNGEIHFGHIAPEFGKLTDKILFDKIWQRTEYLTPRERSLITVASLITQSRPEQLMFHLKKAQENKVSHEALAEVMTHLAFYAGWPSAAAAISQLETLIQSNQ
ncbi:carboxymuconolactone decarboxylase family protein [Marinomonas transparens]|uniref:Carboxymuconolactone decarboxylase family protein n=1 Tax=Marinomonas transparens TaxID=2795388 RepID=A0A934MYD8_9GAMM|nr:carboxymuconolactone decarboxylase family protein [Marinomonas transparens]MBJ7536350.1 carboxymuconolactone decarboxylase family protein [Marinomonas transparens]